MRLVDFDTAGNNEFLVVDQFSVQVAGTDHTRRPDVVLFVNGMPFVVFELKNPADERATLRAAYNQLTETYVPEIPSLFVYNQVLVVSDGVAARFGALGGSFEYFSEWKRVESEEDVPAEGVKPLVQGMFDRVRLLDVVRYFIIFDGGAKKVCRYHQYYGVNNAVVSVVHSVGSASKRAGVFWHTQGSGKTLSMVFLVRKLRHMVSPLTVVFVTDRRDLHSQAHSAFSSVGFGDVVKEAGNREELQSLLRDGGNRVLFTTLQRFEKGTGVVNDSEGILVIADEAHRSQYDEWGARMREALPRASFMGITGTPISLEDRHTRSTFGEYVSKYTIDRATADGVVVDIFYEPRYVPLGLNPLIDEFPDAECDEFDGERRNVRMADVLGSADRVETIAKDIVKHYNGRKVEGKAMVATAGREIAFRLYSAMRRVPEAPEVGLVLSDYTGLDGVFPDSREVERRFKSVDDPLKIVVVCDMWLTGFDVPHLHTLYIDKPLRNHTLLQAVARVNRVFREKAGGLVIDYIGISGNLKRSLSAYSQQDVEKVLIPMEELEEKMTGKYREILGYLGTDCLDCSDAAEVFQRYYSAAITDPDSGRVSEHRKEDFLSAVLVCIKAYQLLIPHNERARGMRGEVRYIEKLAKTVRKNMGDRQDTAEGHRQGIGDAIDRYIKAEGMRSLFGDKFSSVRAISILDEKFIQGIDRVVNGNALIDHIRAIIQEEMKALWKKNPLLAEGVREKVEELLRQYEEGIISSAEVMARLVRCAKDMEESNEETGGLALNDTQQAIYSALLKGERGKKIKDAEVRGHIDEIIRRVKEDITIDWLNNENIVARVKVTLRDYLLTTLEFDLPDASHTRDNLFKQIEVIFADYCPVS